jgi:hypothetical protein
MAMYVLAVACIALGSWLAGYTKINLLTNQVSSPYQVIGYVLIAAGVLVAVVTSRQAKRRIRK